MTKFYMYPRPGRPRLLASPLPPSSEKPCWPPDQTQHWPSQEFGDLPLPTTHQHMQRTNHSCPTLTLINGDAEVIDVGARQNISG